MLRDTEVVPLPEKGGVEAFRNHEVLPYAVDVCHVPDIVKTGHEISFTRYFYKPQSFHTLEKETERLLDEIIEGGRK